MIKVIANEVELLLNNVMIKVVVGFPVSIIGVNGKRYALHIQE